MTNETLEPLLIFLGTVVTVWGGVTVAKITRQGASPDPQTAAPATRQAVQSWTEQQTEVVRRLITVEEKLDATQDELSKTQAAHEKTQAALAAISRRLERVLARVRPLVAWLDEGALPPPPQVHDELRELLAEVDEA